MPWPKGKPVLPDQIARRVAGFLAVGGRRKKSDDGRWLCVTCQSWLPAQDFYRDRKHKNGLKSQCKRCHCSTTVRTRNRDSKNARNVVNEAQRRARKANSGGSVRLADLRQLVELLGAACLRCGSVEVPTWDHIQPLARGGAHHPSNLQPLCRPCNTRKHASVADYRTPEQITSVNAIWRIAFERASS